MMHTEQPLGQNVFGIHVNELLNGFAVLQLGQVSGQVVQWRRETLTRPTVR